MFPMVDLLFQKVLVLGLNHLSKNPDIIRKHFQYADKKTKESVIKLITEYKIPVRTSYPHKDPRLPCIIIQIIAEDQESHGLGGGRDMGYPELGSLGDGSNYTSWTKEDSSSRIRERTFMNMNLQIESWSVNPMVNQLLYAVVKYILLSSTFELEKDHGLMNMSISGGDLEPMTEIVAEPVFRRAVIVSFKYTIEYFVGDLKIGKEDDHFNLGTTIDNIEMNMKGDGLIDDREEESND